MRQTGLFYFLAGVSLAALMLASLPAEAWAETGRNRDARGTQGMVATAHPQASRIGLEILKQGGNAVDAAVAVGFALGVLEPNAGGLGGGGFMLLRLAEGGESICLDFRERAPLAASPGMYKLDKKGRPLGRAHQEGPLSVAVPGEVAGLLAALDKYGSMSREQVMEPAIKQAEKGIKVSPVLAGLIMLKYELLSADPGSAAIYLNEGLPREAGDLIKNPDLVRTLKLISQKGSSAFYQGELAESLAACMKKRGGIITRQDLAEYRVKFRKPLMGTYRGRQIISVPPPSAGGAHLIELLNIMENLKPADCTRRSAASCHLWAEAMGQIYADRAAYMGDGDFVKIPLKGLVSKAYAKDIFKGLDRNKIRKEAGAGRPPDYESGSTTHYSIADKQGNLVAVTKTINHFFGSGITVPGTGILLNDEMADFSLLPGGPNSIAPGKRPLSNMSPTLVLKGGKPWAALGTPGGRRIIPSLALIISNLIDQGMDIQAAIEEPRLYCSGPGKLKLESRFSPALRGELTRMGYKLDLRKEYDLYFGGAQGVVRDPETGELHGGADPRRDGKALGY